MKRLLATLFGVLFSIGFANADDFVIPHPMGTVEVIFGYDSADTHFDADSRYSLDFRAYEGSDRCKSYGAPILATKAGKVEFIKDAGEDGSYGTYVKIKNKDETVTIYAHMIEWSRAVNKGDTVEQGQILGILGDTGLTFGAKCQAFDGVNEGAHLHFENRDKDNLALKPEPLVGKIFYESIILGKYTSTTLMYDPTGHWAKYAGKVPYRLTYNPTRVASFGPLIIEGGKEQVFTIKGENLFENLKVSLPGCKGGLKWLKKESDEQQFTCALAKPSKLEIKPGFIEFGAERVNFKIEVLPDSSLPAPVITKAEAINPVAGKVTDFVVRGTHLPGELRLAMSECEDMTLKSVSPELHEFSCKLPITLYEDGRRVNGIHTFKTQLTSELGSYSYPFSFSADYAVGVFNFTPPVAQAGESTRFTFTGKNLHLVQVAWIENCEDLREGLRTDDSISFECIFRTEEEDSLMSLLLPNILKQDKRRVVLKDKSGGTTLFESKISVFYFKNPRAQLPEGAGEKLYSENVEGGGMSEDGETDGISAINLPNMNDNEAIIKYIIEANGNYDSSFLSKLGWQNVGTREEPVYKLLNCKQGLKNIGKGPTGRQLNTTGECAEGLNSMFLED